MAKILESIGQRFADAGEAFMKVVATIKKPKQDLVMASQFLSNAQTFKLAALLISKNDLTVTKIFMGSHFYKQYKKNEKMILGDETNLEIYSMAHAIKINDKDYYSNEIVEIEGREYLLKVIPMENRVEVNYYAAE